MNIANRQIAVGLLGLFASGTVYAEPPASWRAGHPRLFFDADELIKLRAVRTGPVYADMWRNIADSAEWCLKKTPRAEWIAPNADDPNYENLYDRFYAMMMDMAITEHLALAYALSGDERYGDAARKWTLACCRSWKPDAEAQPDGGKAYAVMRLLKGVAVGYDLAYERFTAEERAEIVTMLSATAANYFDRYFTTPAISGPGFHTHHAIVEWSSFGIAALALHEEVPAACQWLDATVVKFTDHLLPNGLAPDGAQVEGATFWASTMHYRIFLMDALRRVTGRDLFKEFSGAMNADLAMASIAGEKRAGWDKPHETVVLSPSYGQLNYYAPVLLALAKEYDKPHFQYLALWDKTLGGIQETRYITPKRREQLLFELGGYAYCWYSPAVKAEAEEAPLSFRFPSVYQAYARESWLPLGMVAAIDRGGQAIVHAGGAAVLVASGQSNESKTVPEIEDDGTTAVLRWKEGESSSVTMTLRRPGRVRVEWKGLPEQWTFWCLEPPVFADGVLTWRDAIQLRAVDGRISRIETEGYQPIHAVGNGKLHLINPEPERYPLITVSPAVGGLFSVEVSRQN